jgi:ABC-type ATPase involved in cell division
VARTATGSPTLLATHDRDFLTRLPARTLTVEGGRVG